MPPGPALPPFKRYTDFAKSPPLPNSQYGQVLLDEYQYAQSRMVAGMRRINVQGDPGGPLYHEFAAAYSPPPPVWKQELDEGACRFFTGILPGVNLLTNQICQTSPMSDTARTFIDIGAGTAGRMLGARFGKAGDGFLGHIDPLSAGKGAMGDLLGKLYNHLLAKPGAASVHVAAPAPLSADVDPQLGEAMSRIEGAPSLSHDYALTHALVDRKDSGHAGIRCRHRRSARTKGPSSTTISGARTGSPRC